MNNYLTWNDIKHLVKGSFDQAFLFFNYMEYIYKNRPLQKQFENELKRKEEEVLSIFSDMPEKFKEIPVRVTLFQKEDKLEFRTDANLFLQSVMHECTASEMKKEDYLSISDIYYSNDLETFIEEVKKILKGMKAECTEAINNPGPLFRKIDGNVQLAVKDTLIERRKWINWMIRNLEKVLEVYEVEIEDELLNLLNQDKFLLLVAQFDLKCASLSKTTRHLETDTSYFPFLKDYCLYVDYRREEENYNPNFTLKSNYLNQNEKSVSAVEIVDFMKRLSNQEPELELPSYGCQNYEELLKTRLPELYEQKEKERIALENKKRLEAFKKDIQLSWELIPESTQSNEGPRKSIFKEMKTDAERKELAEKKEQLLEEKLDLFKDLPYIATLRGVNHFDGYIAYVFPNGKVIFEKFYKKTRQGLEPVMNEAIYIMGIENFSSLSRQSKSEIREFIKEGNDPFAKVIYHFKNFKEKVLSEVENIEYNEEVLNYINTLVDQTQKDKEYEKVNRK